MDLPPGIDPEIDKKRPPSKKSKTKFTKEEDEIIIRFVHDNGAYNWAGITPFLPNRTPRQVRERWVNYLNPDVSRDEWTQAEDDLLIKLHSQFGSKWAFISRSFKNRTDVSLKNRFTYLRRKETTKIRDQLMTKIPKKALNNLAEQLNPTNAFNYKEQNISNTNHQQSNTDYQVNLPNTNPTDYSYTQIENEQTITDFLPNIDDQIFETDYFQDQFAGFF